MLCLVRRIRRFITSSGVWNKILLYVFGITYGILLLKFYSLFPSLTEWGKYCFHEPISDNENDWFANRLTPQDSAPRVLINMVIMRGFEIILITNCWGVPVFYPFHHNSSIFDTLYVTLINPIVIWKLSASGNWF